MKKLPTVVTSRPNCLEMVICISLDGRFVSLKMACRVRRWMSVKTRRGFLGVLSLGFGSTSLALHAAMRQITQKISVNGPFFYSFKFTTLHSGGQVSRDVNCAGHYFQSGLWTWVMGRPTSYCPLLSVDCHPGICQTIFVLHS